MAIANFSAQGERGGPWKWKGGVTHQQASLGRSHTILSQSPQSEFGEFRARSEPRARAIRVWRKKILSVVFEEANMTTIVLT